MRGSSILFFLLLLACPRHPVHGDEGDATQFFPEGFARTPLEKRPTPRASQPQPATPPSTAAAPLGSQSDNGMVLLDGSTPTPSPSPADEAPTEEPLMREDGVKVNGIRLFVNGDDRAHYINVLSAVGRVNINYGIPINGIMTVGVLEMQDDNAPPELVRMMLLGTPVSILGVPPPDEYKAERSPLWEIATERGTVLIEGVESIERFLLKGGKLKEHLFEHPPSGLTVVESSPAPSPTASPEN